jgi:hypothetical protein
VEDGCLELLGGSCNQEVRNLAAPLARRGRQALDLERTAQMRSSDLYGLERVERCGLRETGVASLRWYRAGTSAPRVSSVVEVSTSEHVQRGSDTVLPAGRRSAQGFVDRVLDGRRTKLGWCSRTLESYRVVAIRMAAK